MESLIPILIGVAFFVLQAIAASNKKKQQQAQRTAPMPGEYPTPAAPNPLEEWMRHMMSETEDDDEAETYEEQEAVEQPVAVEEKLYPRQVGASSAYATATASVNTAAPQAAQNTQSTLAAIAETQSEEEKSAFAEQTEILHSLIDEPFDVERALVYSEILKPKYF